MKTKQQVIKHSFDFLAIKKINSPLVILLLSCIMSFSYTTKASDFYWVNGTGNWSDYATHWATSSGGVIYHTTIPSPADNVFFDSNSFTTANNTITVDLSVTYCNNINWTGATNNPTIKGASTLKIFGSLTLATGINFKINFLSFEATTTGNSVTTNGVFLYSSLSFVGVNGGWSLNDSLQINGDIYFNAGTLVSNNQTINCGGFDANQGNVNLGTSAISCDEWHAGAATVTTLNAATCFIKCTSEFYGGANQVYGDVICYTLFDNNNTYHDVTLYYLSGYANIIHNAFFVDIGSIDGSNNILQKAVFTKDVYINNNNTFDTLYFNNPGYIVTLKGTTTVNNALIAIGTCSSIITIASQTPGTQAFINKAAGNVVVNYVLLKDMGTSGGATFTANNSIDAGNVTGWTINSPTAQNLYWVAGTGNWSDVNHWATSSGGAGGSCTPNKFDNVFFDSNSFPSANNTITVDLSVVYCNNMNWTGATNNPTIKGASTLKIFGSLTLATGINFKINFLSFEATTTGNSVTTNGVFLYSSLSFVGVNGGWSLNDSLQINGDIYFNAGTLVSNNQTINCGGFDANQGNVNLGTSAISCDEWHAGAATVTTLNAATCFIKCTSEFYGGANQVYGDVICYTLFDNNNTYHDVTLYYLSGYANIIHNAFFVDIGSIDGSNNILQKAVFTKDVYINNNNTFDTLYFNNPGYIVTLKGTTTVNNALIAIGTCSSIITIASQTPGTQAFINKAAGNVVVNYVLLKDMGTSGGATFTANNSIDAGNVTGWTINSPTAQNLYWVAGTGNWSDVNHWATSSGGAGGSCTPNKFDNVFFDSNSFPSANNTITVDLSVVYCNNMNWTGATNNPTIKGASTLKIFGSLTLATGINFKINFLSFEATTTGNSVTTNGVFLYSSLSFVGVNGGWSLNDSLQINGDIYFNAGTLVSNNQTINCGGFDANQGNVNLGTSAISCDEWHAGAATVTTLNAATCFIKCTSEFYGGANQVYGDVICYTLFDNNNTYHDVTLYYLSGYANIIHNAFFVDIGSIDGSNNILQKAVFTKDVYINNNNTFDTLYFNNPGYIIALKGTITVNNALWTNPIAGFPITIQSYQPGTQANISCPSGNTVCLEYVYLEDINATGGAVFYAGNYSVNLGNNTGWLWTACTPDTSIVWPGDANYDLTADNIDVLYIGLAYGYAGNTRASATTNWVAQPSVDWLQQFANGSNIKHADCDGNGVVNANDTMAVSLNYGQVHPFKLSTPPQLNNFGTDLYFEMPASALTPGSTVSIPIKFGTPANAANNVYGMAFTVNYDPSLIDANTMQINFANSWLGTTANTIHLTKDFPLNGTIDIGCSRTDHVNATGNGTFATLTFTVANNASGPLNLSFSKIVVLDKNEFPIAVNAQSSSVYTSINENAPGSYIGLYPNPAISELTILLPHYSKNAVVTVTNVTGKVIYQNNYLSAQKIDINTSSFETGIYFVQIQTADFISTRKFVVSK